MEVTIIRIANESISYMKAFNDRTTAINYAVNELRDMVSAHKVDSAVVEQALEQSKFYETCGTSIEIDTDELH